MPHESLDERSWFEFMVRHCQIRNKNASKCIRKYMLSVYNFYLVTKCAALSIIRYYFLLLILTLLKGIFFNCTK